MEPLALVLMTAAGLATALGSLPLLVIRRLEHRTHDVLLGLAAGIMLGVAGLDLLPRSAEHAASDGVLVGIGILAGAVTILVLVTAIRRVPLPMPFVRNASAVDSGTAFLLFLALAIHNAPEGMATALGYAQGITLSGHGVALSIALQNIPEGLLVSLAVYAETRSRRAASAYCVLSGVVEPVAGAIALLFLTVEPAGIGVASAFAVGAMLSVVVFQMVPESHRHGYHVAATAAVAAGFAVVFAVDVLLGLGVA